MTLTFSGEVMTITYESEETSFRVVKLGEIEGDKSLGKRTTVIGVMPPIGAGTRIRVVGRLEENQRHGDQVRASSVVPLLPSSLEGIRDYLGSGVIDGLGPGFAARITKQFGRRTLEVLDAEPHRLREVKGLGEARVGKILSAWAEHRVMSNLFIALSAHGASAALAARIVEKYGERAYTVLQNEPYRLALEVPQVGFKTADELARANGTSGEHPDRVLAAMVHQLRRADDSGHCFLPREALLRRTADMIQVSDDAAAVALQSLSAAHLVEIEGDAVFLQVLWLAENQVAADLGRLLHGTSLTAGDVREIEEDPSGIILAESQKAALDRSLENKVSVITGGPGVGKTTIVRSLLARLPQGARIRLAAPTGRAAKRLSESTRRRASTLHRLLEVDGKTQTFQRNRQNPLEVDWLIVDESSMIDVRLARDLLAAVPSTAHVIFVGDVDQLPSVGAGAFLRSMIESDVIAVSVLDVIFRQAGESGIIENSQRILGGELPESDADKSGQFFWSKVSDSAKAHQLAVSLMTRRIVENFQLDPMSDIQVLTPMHKGAAGTVALNQSLQAELNPQGKEIAFGEVRFREGDRVIQTKNDYEKSVFNGDPGRIVEVKPDENLAFVEFEDEGVPRRVEYKKNELIQLTHSWALSIHKSQGSEYPAVIVVLLRDHHVMLSRNLLYTAVTRAKRVCVVVGDPRAVSLAVSEVRKEFRFAALSSRIAEPTSVLLEKIDRRLPREDEDEEGEGAIEEPSVGNDPSSTSGES